MQQGVPLPRNLIRLPMVRQSSNYTCGVASLMSVLQCASSNLKTLI